MKKVVWFLIIVVIVILGVRAFGPKQTTKQVTTTGPIKIGVIAPLTGDAAVYGEPARNIYQIAADEINANGGVNGSNIEFVIEDDKCTGEGAVNATQKLLNVDKVKIIVGSICSGATLAAIPVIESAKAVLISPGASSPDLTGKSKNFFRNYPSDSGQGEAIAETIYGQGKRNVAFIQEQTDYALGIYKSFSSKFVALGGKISKEEFASNIKDFRSIITKLKAQNPDVLFIDTQTPAPAEIILGQLKESGWKVNIVLNDVPLATPTLVTKYKDILEGAIGAEFSIDPSNIKFAKLLETYKTKYNADVPFQSYGQTEYDVIYMIKDAILAVGHDGEKIAKWGHQVKDWQGASGSVTIGENGDRTGAFRAKVIKNGKVELFK